MTSVPSVRPTLNLLGAGAAAYFVMGVLQPIYGPLFPFFQQRFGVSTATVGIIASAHFLGSAAAPPLAGVLLRRLSTRRVVVGSLILLALGAVLVGLAPLWALAVAGAVVAGLGMGGVSAALNAVFASVGTRAINFVNAIFAAASVLAPLIAAGLAPLGLTWPFVLIAALALLTLLAAKVWGLPELPPARPQDTARGLTRPLALFVPMLVCYVGLEVGFGAWGIKHLQGVGFGAAALAVSLYWGGFTLGRLLTSLFGARFQPDRLVLASAVLSTLVALAATVPALAPLAYPLVGLTLGPLFGSVLVWSAGVLPVRLVPFLLVSGSVGGVLVPWLIGVAFARFGPAAVPIFLSGLGALLCVLVVLNRRVLRVP